MAVSVNLATAALHLALAVSGVEGGEVITTSMTFVSTNHAILYNDATPVFADIQATTLNIDRDDIERKITPRNLRHYCRALRRVSGGFRSNL